MLNNEEYVEQAYFFQTLRERMGQNQSTQDLLVAIRHEILATTKLPLALEFMAEELRLTGGFATAMDRLPHYFSPFQTYVITEAERPEGRFDFATALIILEREAGFFAKGATPQGVFLYEFEALCRHRLGYDKGLFAVKRNDIFDDQWTDWIDFLRRHIGVVDLADMIYVRSGHYEPPPDEEPRRALFGKKEGQIALANRRKDPLYLFSALQRHLGYPAIPKPQRGRRPEEQIPLLLRRLERMEMRIKLLEEEMRGGINLTRFYHSGER